MRKAADHPPTKGASSHSRLILNRLAEADPKGMEKEEFRRWAKESGIGAAELESALKPLLAYANIYFNASTKRYHHMWSSSIQYE